MRKKKEGAYERGRENYEFNLQTKMMRDEESKVDKYHDAILLDYALRKEQEANAAEEEKRNADKEAAMKYRKYLEEQMIKEAEDTAFVDEIRKREEERLWKARDDALLARQHARDRLMHMVDEGRQEQIKAKKEFLELEKVEGQKFASKFLSDASAAVRQEKEQMQQRRQQNVENNHRLQQQIDYRRQKEEFEKQEAYLADKHMKHMERLHQQKLAEQGGVVRVNRPLMKNNWGYT